MSNLILIRHGQASFGKGNYDRLSATGLKQADILGSHLCKIIPSFDEIYRGTLERHRETAEGYISNAAKCGIACPEVKIDSRLDEYDTETIFSVLSPVLKEEKPQMKEYFDNLLSDKKSFHIVFSEIMNMWCSGKYDMKGTQTWSGFLSGIYDFLDEMMRKFPSGRTIAVFTSGGPVSAAVMNVLNLSNEKTMLIRDEVSNASITRFRFTGSRIMLSTFNEYSHLETAGGGNIITYR